MLNTNKVMDKIVALCNGRGIIFAGSEIYGGLANTFDYGPLGVLLKNNVKAAWLKKFVQESPYNVGLDSSILLNKAVWQASGHLVNFNDPLIDCKGCKMRYRADKMIEDYAAANNLDVKVEGMDNAALSAYIKDNNVPCANCGKTEFTDIRKFNMMFKTHQGVTEDSQAEVYLRPETAQGIFINFKNIQRSTRKKVPFGVAQIGKSFRNEITPGNFTFRTREFEQMEMEFFCHPSEEMKWFNYWKDFCKNWLLSLNMREDSLRLRDHAKEELSHYSNATTDFEFLFPFGWGELWGVADRTDFDLKAHSEASGETLDYLDPVTNERFIPYVIEPALGCDRVALAFLIDAYDEEDLGEGDSRVVLHLHPALAPYKCAVLPLSKKLSEGAGELYAKLCKNFMCEFDETGSIGKRYRRQDEIGTPFCVTYDFDSANDGCVTIRERDSMTQERVAIDDVAGYIAKRIEF